jgi:hypothetical protein
MIPQICYNRISNIYNLESLQIIKSYFDINTTVTAVHHLPLISHLFDKSLPAILLISICIMSKNLVASVSGIPLHESLQQITRLLQSEFERHENALAEIEHAEKHRLATLPYAGRPGLTSPSGLHSPIGSASKRTPARTPTTSSSSASSSSSSTIATNRSHEKNSSRRRAPSGDHNEQFGEMFLNAALALIEQDSEKRRGASMALGGTQISKEYAPEVIKMGILRKGKGKWTSSRQPKWTNKQIVLCPGRFTYYNLKNQKQSIGQLFDGSGSIDELSHQSQSHGGGSGTGKELNITNCDARPYEKFNSSTGSCFIIFDRNPGKEGNNEKLWMAKDANDREQWIAAIKTASRLTSSDGRLQEDSAHCAHVRDQINQCQTKEQYLSTLGSLFTPLRNVDLVTNVSSNGRVCVPIVWLRKEKQNMASIRNDMTMEQATKDLQRDVFEINGVVYQGNQGGLIQIIGTLAGDIMDAAIDKNINFTEASALTFAREVLYNSNRTQFGGDGYEAVDLVCCNDQLVFATPLGQVAAPIQIQVTTDSGEVNGSRNDDHVFLSVKVTADMIFNLNCIEPPEDDSNMVWSTMTAKFERYVKRRFYQRGSESYSVVVYWW